MFGNCCKMIVKYISEKNISKFIIKLYLIKMCRNIDYNKNIF